jgi:hypothetical protein
MRPVFVRRRSNTRAGRLSGWRLWPALALGAVAMPLSGCTSAQLQGQASSYVIMQALEAASGAAPNQFGGTLASDVQTVVEGSPTIFEDPARVQLVLAMKNPVGEPVPGHVSARRRPQHTRRRRPVSVRWRHHRDRWRRAGVGWADAGSRPGQEREPPAAARGRRRRARDLDHRRGDALRRRPGRPRSDRLRQDFRHLRRLGRPQLTGGPR